MISPSFQIKSSTGSLITDRMESISSGAQDFCVYKKEAPISEPIVKNSAFLQACGEANYSQDLAMSSQDLLHGVYIFNTEHAHAKFDKIIVPDELRQMFPGVVEVFTAEDVDPDPENIEGGRDVDWKPTMMLPVYHRQSVVMREPKDRNNLGRGFPGLPGNTVFAREEVHESFISGKRNYGHVLYYSSNHLA